ncbi:hypothetical protein D4764_02G0000050 [Takifugu flavidus]|uniref:Reverse transcriptase domain-containing protein n=1 Tax=Takifugu flavidus TaxID=433684 RepID=A0A5C6NHJ6_9TELE|nr:hypothetical protein D4764_02G0000050 [Takifugu flavidus]
MKRRRFKPCVPAVITGNVRSLANKMDELEALTRTPRESREASIMCFTETWLHGLIPDSNVTITGFTTVRADRDTTAAGKKKGGGLAVFVSNRWCSPEHIHVKERVCSPHVELVAIGLRPYYLPREFTNVIAITVYIPPTGDFNHASLKSTLPTFHQYVQCSTRDRKTLDLLYANVTNAYTSTALPPLGKSDHNLVLLSPSYTPVVQQQPVTKVRCYPNNKPWVTSDLKALLNKKKRAFTAGDPAELRSVQKELKRSLKESKDAYRKKLEERLERNQTRDVWSGMRTITGFQKKGIRSADGNVDQANELNQFFRPLTPLPTSSPSPLLTPYMDPSMSPIPPTGLSFTSGQVRRELERLNQRKAAGPDGISPRVLRNCSRQLCGILQHLFNQSLHLQRIPVLWKTSCLVPVPKKTHPVAPSDYRPRALTSHIMKVMEQLVLTHLRPLVSPFQDPLQFAYQPKVGVDDAVIYLLQRAYSSLDRLNTTVQVMFFDFSSAFNTIQPRLLRAKLEKMQMDAPLVSWIEDDLTGRPQVVRLRSCVSDPLMSNTGAPQGTVLSPFLFTTYTADFQYHSETCPLQNHSETRPLQNHSETRHLQNHSETRPLQYHSETRHLPNHSETRPLQNHSETRHLPNHSETRPLQNHSETRHLQYHSETRPLQNHSETRPLQSHSETRPLQNHSETRPLQSHSETRPLQSHSETRPLQSHSETRPLQCHSETRPLQNHSETRPLQYHSETRHLQNHSETRHLQYHSETRHLQNHSETRPLQYHSETRPLQNHSETRPLQNHSETHWADKEDRGEAKSAENNPL